MSQYYFTQKGRNGNYWMKNESVNEEYARELVGKTLTDADLEMILSLSEIGAVGYDSNGDRWTRRKP